MSQIISYIKRLNLVSHKNNKKPQKREEEEEGGGERKKKKKRERQSRTSKWCFWVLCLPSAPQGQAKGVNIHRSPDSSQSTCSLSVQMDCTSAIAEWSIFLVR